MIVLTVANLKGGAGKTSVSVMLAWWAARAAQGQRVVLLDMDRTTPSATHWHAAAGLNTFETRQATKDDVVATLAQLRAAEDVAVVIIDTPALGEMEIVTAGSESDLILIPFRSGSGDVGQVAQTLPLLALPARVNPDLSVLGVMIATGDAPTVDRETRDQVEQAELSVADAQIPNLRLYTTAKGNPISSKNWHYEKLWKEIQEVLA